MISSDQFCFTYIIDVGYDYYHEKTITMDFFNYFLIVLFSQNQSQKH